MEGIDFICQDFGFCQDFVSRQKGGRKEGQELRSLEVREASSSHLKIVRISALRTTGQKF